MPFDTRHQRATPATHTDDAHRPRTAPDQRGAQHQVDRCAVLPRTSNGSQPTTRYRPTTRRSRDRDTPAIDTTASHFERVHSIGPGGGSQ